MKNRRSGFTLVEILVVLGIIALLAALLFPAFSRARENGRQTSCASNLQQIYMAVAQYKADERAYPDSLLDLLGEGANYVDSTGGAAATLGSTASGYFKGGQDSLICMDDDTIPTLPRSSYGYLSKAPVSATLPPPATTTTPFPSTFTGDMGQYVWNYWGYRSDGFAYTTEAEATTANGGGTTCAATPATAQCTNLVRPELNYNKSTNPVKFSLSNRFAPPSTIITHCVYHRLPTANNLNAPTELYNVPEDSKNARDIVVRLDGSYKAVDVSPWASTTPSSLWQKQTQ